MNLSFRPQHFPPWPLSSATMLSFAKLPLSVTGLVLFFLTSLPTSDASHTTSSGISIPIVSRPRLAKRAGVKATHNGTTVVTNSYDTVYMCNITLNGAEFEVLIDTGRCVDFIMWKFSSSHHVPFVQLRPMGRRRSSGCEQSQHPRQSHIRKGVSPRCVRLSCIHLVSCQRHSVGRSAHQIRRRVVRTISGYDHGNRTPFMHVRLCYLKPWTD